jgi:hypothetical protein
MRFHTPRDDCVFEIPDEWWQFAEMDRFSPNGRRFFTYDSERYPDAEGIAIDEIEPPQRSEGVELLRKYKLVPVLMAFRSPEGMLPPVDVRRASMPSYRFKLLNGAHRYFASVAAGFPLLAVIVRE